ncbi:hypothetical protein BC830DRAFT_953328 [Chytriomyces sp. MP71]|nr:hypothetical protein BC830DRAFT_953328 [Chytriomyces sp. MP71]
MTKLAATTLSKNKKKHMVEDPIVADIVEESDMDLCSQQPSSQPTIATTSSMYLKSKIPAASSRHANPSTKNALVPDNPCGWGSIPASVAAVTDFSVPMVIKGSKMKADVSSATPKALPRHHPTKPGVQLQSILKPATPSFDAKLAMKVATGTTVVSLVHQKNGTSTIEDPILEGLYEGTKKAGSGSVLSGVGGNKESNGPATIVDANGELPEIQE